MLRKGQKELVETYRSGYCGVPAIPGGGKTFALTKWAVQVIKEGKEKPGKILIVTYMTSAVNNFKQRISNELERLGIISRDYYVSTIHSLCLQIIKEKPDMVGINDDVEVIDQTRKNLFIRDAAAEWKRKGNNGQLYIYYLDEEILNKKGYDDVIKKWDNTFINLMANAISDFKTEGISPKEARSKTEGLKPFSFLKIAAEIYFGYEKRLHNRGLIDFEDMLVKAKSVLENDKIILEKYRKKYTYICEDEAQDSNKMQTEILTLIAGENGNFLRVGDSNQAIMTTFANSDMALFKEFCFSRADYLFNIVQSSRNARQIIDLANGFVKYVIENHPTKECRDSLLPQYIEEVPEDDEFPNPVINDKNIFTNTFTKREDEYEYISEKCAELIQTYPEKTTAVLLPDSYKIRGLIEKLTEKKVPFDYLDSFSEERNATLIILGRILDFVSAPDKNEKLIELIRKMISEEAIGREELCEWLKTAETADIFYPVTGLTKYINMSDNLQKTPAWGEFIKLKPIIKDFLEFPINVPEKLVLYIAERLNFGREEVAIAQKVASGVKFLMEENERYKLSDLAFELLQQKNSFNYFANLVWELKGYEPKPGVVAIATYHKAKGLEWDNVFLGTLISEDFPTRVNEKFKDEIYYLKSACKNPSALIKKDLNIILKKDADLDFELEARINFISERARLLYVGITRAKERLYISTINNRITKPSVYFMELENLIK